MLIDRGLSIFIETVRKNPADEAVRRYIINGLPFTIYGLLFTIYYLRITVYYIRITIYCFLITIHHWILILNRRLQIFYVNTDFS